MLPPYYSIDDINAMLQTYTEYCGQYRYCGQTVDGWKTYVHVDHVNDAINYGINCQEQYVDGSVDDVLSIIDSIKESAKKRKKRSK